MSAAAAATHAHNWRASTSVAKAERWGCPPALYLALDQEFRFTLDVAADAGNAKHVRYLTKDTDALTVSWAGERVFCNPPYGRTVDRWLRKAVFEVQARGLPGGGRCELAAMLLPARVGNKWYRELCLPYAQTRVIPGRLGFTLGGAGRDSAPFDSMVMVYRPGAEGRGTITVQPLYPFQPRKLRAHQLEAL